MNRNLEPEYIAFSADQKTAYICLQEASAIATVDLTTKAVTSVKALGHKDWKALGLPFDASDKDDGINMNIWPVVGQPMPDTIATFTVGGVEYIATANEGDAVEYGDEDTANYFACEERGGFPDMLDASIESCDLKAALSDTMQVCASLVYKASVCAMTWWVLGAGSWGASKSIPPVVVLPQESTRSCAPSLPGRGASSRRRLWSWCGTVDQKWR